MADDYKYLLPVFVGHPFRAPHTEELRRAVRAACDKVNADQPPGPNRFRWEPRFLADVDHSDLQTVFERVRAEIEESALTVFDLSDQASVNIFFEMGMAVGLHRGCVILCRDPYRPPADLRAVVRRDYQTEDQLREHVEHALRDRLYQLRHDWHQRDVLDLKLQIDAVWDAWIKGAAKGLSIFAGDLSWVDARKGELAEAIRERDVNVKVFCLHSASLKPRVVEYLRTLVGLGAEVKILADAIDPRVRGLIVEPHSYPDTSCKILVVEKHDRRNVVYGYTREGISVGESQFRYRGTMYRGSTHLRQTTAMVRLFEFIWEKADAVSLAPPVTA